MHLHLTWLCRTWKEPLGTEQISGGVYPIVSISLCSKHKKGEGRGKNRAFSPYFLLHPFPFPLSTPVHWLTLGAFISHYFINNCKVRHELWGKWMIRYLFRLQGVTLMAKPSISVQIVPYVCSLLPRASTQSIYFSVKIIPYLLW